MKETWRIINETLGKTNQKNNLPMFIEHNNTLITDPNRIANTFNDYFVNIGSDLASNKIHEDDILKIISKMGNKSCSCYNMFSNKIIKAFKRNY